MKFSKEEVSLCKQVAERYGKQLSFGDWVVINFPELKKPKVILFDTKWGECPDRFPDSHAVYNISTDKYYKEYFPLWTISDCLEWLQEKVETIELWRTKTTKKWICRLRNGKWYKANVPLEACLKAVLAVLEEEQ